MPQYQGVWTLQQQMQALTSGRWATDPLFDYTTLLLQADNAANSAQNNTFLDSSTNAFAITRNGNTTQGSFSPFSATGWSGYFDGTSDYIQYTNSDFSVSTGDFTAEWWMFITSDKSQVGIMTASTNSNLTIGYGSGSANARQPYVEWGGSGAYIGTMSGYMNTWVHICIMRSSGTVYTFQNGVLLGSASKSAAVGSTANMVIGTNAGDSAAQSVPGYLSNVRFAKAAIYSTSGFTPATTAFTRTSQNATNVQFLTLQSNRFLDSNGVNTPASSPLDITRNGDVSVQAFSPFAPQYQWTSDVIGGSGYFDGTGDFLTVASNSAFDFPGNATVELWIYFTGNMGVRQDIIHHASNGFEILKLSGDTIYCGFGGGTITSSITVKANQWYHIALVRSSTGASGLNLYINGANVGSATAASSVTSGTMAIGAQATGNQPVSGYMSSLRIVKGTAVYTSAFTPPTAPTTAVSGTSLLLNFTNAGIYDGTMKNNLETVGNASVSTSVVKYGSGSMYFDGTGDYLIAPAGPQFDFSTGDFTIEFWAYPLTSGATTVFYEQWVNGVGSYVTGQLELQKNTSNQLVFYVSTGASTNATLTTTNTLASNTWTHVAVCRSNGVVRAFFNGVQDSTTLALTTQAGLSNRTPTIGVELRATTSYYNGYLDDFRITKGIARYTQNFIPPSVALPRQ